MAQMTQTTGTSKTRRRRKDARPSEIIAAGMAEFTEHGFAGAKLDRIAKAAGIAKGTIYLYFESKEALFEATARTYILSTIEEVAADTSSFQGTTDELMRRFVARLYGQMASGHAPALMRILIAEGHRFPVLVERYHEVILSRGIEVLSAIIQRGISRGELRDGAATQVPQLLIAPAVFFVVNQLIFGERHSLDLDAYMNGHIDMVLKGISKQT